MAQVTQAEPDFDQYTDIMLEVSEHGDPNAATFVLYGVQSSFQEYALWVEKVDRAAGTSEEILSVDMEGKVTIPGDLSAKEAVTILYRALGMWRDDASRYNWGRPAKMMPATLVWPEDKA